MHGDSPLQAGTLHYAGVDIARRPTLLTALGICSIVFASLGLLFNLAQAGQNAWELWGWSFQASPSLPGTSADTTTAGSLTAAEAELIAAALAEIQPLSEDERTRLAAALRDAESPIAPPATGPWTAAHVKRQVVDSAMHLPGDPYTEDDGEDADVEDPSGEEGQVEQEVYAEREVFFDFDANGYLSVYEDQIYLMAWPMDGSTIETTVWANGTIDVTDDSLHEEFWWDVQLWLTLLLALLAAALAVLLLVAGIQTLRDRPLARRLHQVWAWARIALSILATALAAWILALEGDLGIFGDYYWLIMIIAIAFQFLLTASYPIIVLLVLRSRRIGDWYGGGPSPA